MLTILDAGKKHPVTMALYGGLFARLHALCYSFLARLVHLILLFVHLNHAIRYAYA